MFRLMITDYFYSLNLEENNQLGECGIHFYNICDIQKFLSNMLQEVWVGDNTGDGFKFASESGNKAV